MASIIRKLNSKFLSIEDLSYLNKLLKTNMSLANSLSLLKSKTNEKMINSIINDLDNGVLIEKSIERFVPKQIDNFLSPLLKSLPFSASLDISLSFYDRYQDNQKQILSSIGYPCILMFISISGLYLFDLYGIDTIFSILRSFDTELGLFTTFRHVLRIMIYIFYYGILIIFILVLFYSRPSKITFLYLLLSKYFPNSLVNISYCEQFVSLLLICIKKGYKTKQSLQILMNMKTKPIISFLAYHLDENLLKGETLKEASKQIYYDNSLSRFIKIANYSNDFENVLQSYVILAQEKIFRKTKKYALTIQLITYLFIGIIIIFIYQVLFLPMQTLGQL